jgi:hypothetical protein
MRVTLPSSRLATQTARGPTAIPNGPAPTSIGSPSGSCERASTLMTVPSLGLDTHTDPSPTASPASSGLPAERPTSGGDVETTLPVHGSIRVTVPAMESKVQTEPSPTATARGRSPTRIGSPTTRFELGSTLMTEESNMFATQTAPSPAATPTGPLPTGIGLPTW